MSNDYIIAFDMTGSPYIAHMGPSVTSSHKYVMKVIAENGKAIYFYTLEAYEKWRKNLQNKKSDSDKAKTLSNSKPHQCPPDEIPEGWSSGKEGSITVGDGNMKTAAKSAAKGVFKSIGAKTEEQLRKELKAKLAKKSR